MKPHIFKLGGQWLKLAKSGHLLVREGNRWFRPVEPDHPFFVNAGRYGRQRQAEIAG